MSIYLEGGEELYIHNDAKGITLKLEVWDGILQEEFCSERELSYEELVSHLLDDAIEVAIEDMTREIQGKREDLWNV